MKIYVLFGYSLPLARVRYLFLQEYVSNQLRLFDLRVLKRCFCRSRGTQIPELTVFHYANDLEMGPVVAPSLTPADQQAASVTPAESAEQAKRTGWNREAPAEGTAEASVAGPSTASTNPPDEPTPPPVVEERPVSPKGLQDRVRVTMIPASGNLGSFPIRLVEMRAALEGKPTDVEHAIGASTDNGDDRQQVGQGRWKRVLGPILRAIGIGALAM